MAVSTLSTEDRNKGGCHGSEKEVLKSVRDEEKVHGVCISVAA